MGVQVSTQVRHVLQRLLAVLLLTVFAASCFQTIPVEPSSRPNIILILTDDQNADTVQFMPTVQKLMAEGTTFTKAYAPTALCCPSRASLLRGQYPHNHGVRSNDGLTGGFPQFFNSEAESSTLATWLQNDNYRTALIGKYFNAYPEGKVPPPGFTSPGQTYVPPGWDEWYGLIDIPGDARNSPYAMYNYPMNQNGRVVRYGNTPGDYQTDVLRNLAVDFVTRSAKGSEPFFLYLAPTAPHEPAVPAPRHQNLFPGLQAPRPPSFNEADMSDKPAWLAGRALMSDSIIADLDAFYRNQAQMLQAVDEMIAALMETLRETGELDSTYVVFMADNGLHYGEHRIAKLKLTPYEASARVPLVVSGPNVPKGQNVDALTLVSDVAPTLTDLVGSSAPDFVDGRSLGPWLGKRSAAAPRQQLLQEFWPVEGLNQSRLLPIPTYGAVRSEDYLYVDYTYPDGREELELYDLESDSYELTNIASSADPALLAALSDKLGELMSCQASGCRQAEDSAFYHPLFKFPGFNDFYDKHAPKTPGRAP